jgi:hypothetical protein
LTSSFSEKDRGFSPYGHFVEKFKVECSLCSSADPIKIRLQLTLAHKSDKLRKRPSPDMQPRLRSHQAINQPQQPHLKNFKY